MSEIKSISISSMVKGHHVSNYNIPKRFLCSIEENNFHSQYAIVVRPKSDMEKIIGHVPDSLSEILQPLMKNGVVIRLNGKIVHLSTLIAHGRLNEWAFKLVFLCVMKRGL